MCSRLRSEAIVLVDEGLQLILTERGQRRDESRPCATETQQQYQL